MVEQKLMKREKGQKINKAKSLLLEKINKIKNLFYLPDSASKISEKANTANIRNKRGDIITALTTIKRIRQVLQFNAYKCNNLDASCALFIYGLYCVVINFFYN